MKYSVFLLPLMMTAGLHCAREHRTELHVVGAVDGPSGFTCREQSGSGQYLAQRAQVFNGAACAVVDFLPLGNAAPTCDPGVLMSYCDQNRCAPDLRTRARLPMQLTAAALSDPRRATEVFSQLTNMSVVQNAPDGPVLMRLVLVAGPCDRVPDGTDGTFDCNTLIGCAYSCPVLLDQVSEVLLGLPTTSASVTCQPTVEYCANLTTRCGR